MLFNLNQLKRKQVKQIELIVNADNTILLSSLVGTNTQTVCINTLITNITYNTTGATGANFTGLPAGVNGSWRNSVVTITGTPTVAGNSTYTVTLSGGCGTATATGTITVTPANTILLTSAAGTNSQTPCINTPINIITYLTTGTTGANFSGLPTGITGSWTDNVVTISGTPTIAGNNSYTVTLTGGCGNITTLGTINVTGNGTIALSSAAETASQTLCVNNGISNIVYDIDGTANGATVTGLPTGIGGSYNTGAKKFTITGTPTISGTFNYSITTTGSPCNNPSLNGTIRVNANGVIALSSTATSAQTICLNSSIIDIAYTIGGTATGASASGLPSGVTGNYSSGLFTISGTPSFSGTYYYTVSTTGSPCANPSLNGTIIVRPAPAVTIDVNGANTICSGETTTIKFTGTDNGLVTYNINGGSNKTLTLKNGGNEILTTDQLSSDTQFNLVSVAYGDDPDCNNAVSGSVIAHRNNSADFHSSTRYNDLYQSGLFIRCLV